MSATDSTPGLTVFFPAYNDSGTIASMVVSAVLAAGRLTPDFEVIVINDGSGDATPLILDELARVYPQVRIVHHPLNRGYGGAREAGSRTPRRSGFSIPTATRSTTRGRCRCSGSARRPASTS